MWREVYTTSIIYVKIKKLSNEFQASLPTQRHQQYSICQDSNVIEPSFLNQVTVHAIEPTK
jgi:hypothetical protein